MNLFNEFFQLKFPSFFYKFFAKVSNELIATGIFFKPWDN